MAEFLQNNWFWILLVLVFVGMHSFGGGCCGMGHRREKGGNKKNPEKAENRVLQDSRERR
ncbi:MAG: DUF2933 domain-containing protein [Candidatus Binatia bacterium]